ncbi:hypothetical protein ACFSY7_17980 [Kurthia populi]|uniref:Uncharacterized protein n=1 Tax=Kurthia populi TaxID=1562132 RepID=A0ABW5Y568_9BACL
MLSLEKESLIHAEIERYKSLNLKIDAEINELNKSLEDDYRLEQIYKSLASKTIETRAHDKVKRTLADIKKRFRLTDTKIKSLLKDREDHKTIIKELESFFN